jgi:hypothetical protein
MAMTWDLAVYGEVWLRLGFTGKVVSAGLESTLQ